MVAPFGPLEARLLPALIEPQIRDLQEEVRRLSVGGIRGGAVVESDVDARAGGQRRLGDLRADALRDGQGGEEVRRGENDDELVAAPAAPRVDRAEESQPQAAA